MGLNYNPASVTQGLVYYLDFTNTRCYSGSGNTLINLANGAIGITIVSGITYDTDNRKNLNFNGSSGYMTGNDTNLDFSTSDFTIQTTFKLNGLSNGFTAAYGSVVCAGSALTNNSSILQFSGTASSHYAIQLWHQPSTTLIGRNYNFQTNKIYNLAVTKRFNVVEFFVDGSSIGTTTSSNNFNFTANGFAIGRWYYPGYEQYLKGSIFDFRAYNRALSLDEIQQNYFSQTKRYYNEENIVTNGLILNLDPGNSRSYSGTGNTIYDLAGTGNSGNLTNGPTFSSTNGGALVFDGVNDSVKINNIMFGTLYSKATSYSCELWMYINNTQNYTANGDNDIVENGGGNYPFVIRYERPLLRTAVYDGVNFPQSNFAFTKDAWIHFALVVNYSDNTAYNYLNGVLVSTFSVAAITNTFTSTDFYLFSRNGTINWTTGKLGPLHMYNRALSQQEISQNFNATRSRFGI